MNHCYVFVNQCLRLFFCALCALVNFSFLRRETNRARKGEDKG